MAALAQMKPGSSGSSVRSPCCSAACAGRSRRPHSSKPWRATAVSSRNLRRCASVTGAAAGGDAEARTVGRLVERRHEQRRAVALDGRRRPPRVPAPARRRVAAAERPAAADRCRAAPRRPRPRSSPVMSCTVVTVSRASRSGRMAASASRVTMASSAASSIERSLRAARRVERRAHRRHVGRDRAARRASGTPASPASRLRSAAARAPVSAASRATARWASAV